MAESDSFKWRHYQGEIIPLCVRWYLRYALSYRDLQEMMRERGLSLDHTKIYRWVQAYAPKLEKRIRPHLRLTNDSYRVDETYVKIKGKWYYLYRAVDSTGQTIDFLLIAKRDARAAKRFFRKALKAPKHQSPWAPWAPWAPWVINVDQSRSYPLFCNTTSETSEGLVNGAYAIGAMFAHECGVALPGLVRSATQYRQNRSLIQAEAQTYRILPLVPNPTPTFFVKHANGDVHKIVVRGLRADCKSMYPY